MKATKEDNKRLKIATEMMQKLCGKDPMSLQLMLVLLAIWSRCMEKRRKA